MYFRSTIFDKNYQKRKHFDYTPKSISMHYFMHKINVFMYEITIRLFLILFFYLMQDILYLIIFALSNFIFKIIISVNRSDI